jgi:general secretion pathway protein D
MKIPAKAWIACVALAAPLALVFTVSGTAVAQGASSSTPAGVPIAQIIEAVAKKTNKSFVLDPRVLASVTLIGIDPAKVTYPELLSILQVHGFAAVESEGLVRVVPDAFVRTEPIPLVGANDKHPEAEVVTRVIKLKSIPSPQLVPILRPLVHQSGHLAAFPCTNEMLIVDTFANVRRIESIISAMDKGDALSVPKCAGGPPPARE